MHRIRSGPMSFAALRRLVIGAGWLWAPIPLPFPAMLYRRATGRGGGAGVPGGWGPNRVQPYSFSR